MAQAMPEDERDGRVSYTAYNSVASHLRADEQDKIRVFRVIRSVGCPWIRAAGNLYLVANPAQYARGRQQWGSPCAKWNSSICAQMWRSSFGR